MGRAKRSPAVDRYSLPSALPVDDDPSDDLSLPPSSAEGYLRRVRKQAEECFADDYLVADDLVSTTASTTFQAGNARQTSPHDWPKERRLLAVADFADTRQAVVRYLATANDPRRALSDSGSASALPPLSDKAKWRHVCTNAEVGEGAPPVAPLLSRVATLETGDIESLIFRNLEWLRESNSVSQSQLQWLFALLSQLDRSFLSPSATALLRDLLRLCQSIRDTLDTTTEGDTADGCTLLMVIVADYFAQRDLY